MAVAAAAVVAYNVDGRGSGIGRAELGAKRGGEGSRVPCGSNVELMMDERTADEG